MNTKDLVFTNALIEDLEDCVSATSWAQTDPQKRIENRLMRNLTMEEKKTLQRFKTILMKIDP